MAETSDVVVKSGAEGLVCAAVLGSGVGVAVKAGDGASRAGRWEAPSENARCTQAYAHSVGVATQRGNLAT